MPGGNDEMSEVTPLHRSADELSSAAGKVAGRSRRLGLRLTSENHETFALCGLRLPAGAIETANGLPDFGGRSTITSRPSLFRLTRRINGSVRHQTYSASTCGLPWKPVLNNRLRPDTGWRPA